MKRQFKPDCRRVKAGLSGTALALAVSSFLTFQPVQPVQAADEPPASGAADLFAGMDSPAPGGGDYESRLSYHRDNKGDLRIPPIAAADRRRAIPNDNRPPLQREPSVKLPPLPADMENVVRRVNIPGGEKSVPSRLTFASWPRSPQALTLISWAGCRISPSLPRFSWAENGCGHMPRG